MRGRVQVNLGYRVKRDGSITEKETLLTVSARLVVIHERFFQENEKYDVAVIELAEFMDPKYLYFILHGCSLSTASSLAAFCSPFACLPRTPPRAVLMTLTVITPHMNLGFHIFGWTKGSQSRFVLHLAAT